MIPRAPRPFPVCFQLLYFICSVAATGHKGHHGDEPDYEVVVPRKVTESGEFISNFLPHYYERSGKTNGGRNRSQDKVEDAVHYIVPFSGSDYILELRPNAGIIGPGTVIETHRGKRLLDRDLHRINESQCYYAGKVMGDDDSKVAISTCHGLTGYVRTKRNYFLIQPVVGYQPHDENELPHLLKSFNDDDNDNPVTHCKETGNVTKLRSKRSARNDMGNNTTCGEEFHVETLIVVDRSMLNYHKEIDLENYILTVFNMAHDLYHDASLGVNINLVIVRIIKLEQEDHEMNLAINGDIAKTMEYFGEWQHKINPVDDSHPNHHDVAVLITRTDLCDRESNCGLLGASIIGGMCDPKNQVAICEDNGLRLGFVIAHEIAHTFAIIHDTPRESGCEAFIPNNLTTVMSPTISIRTAGWSNCSSKFLRFFFDSGFGKCLYDTPVEHGFTLMDLLPGVMYDGDFQCKEVLGPNAALCMTGIDCKNLICYVEDKGCIETHTAVAPGTTCGEKKWCYHGECVHMGERLCAVDGQWGPWSEWSECSRSCGSGVASQERHCDSPSPSHGGKYCDGDHKRYKICSTEPCDPSQPSFRDMQCSEFNSWIYPEDGKLHVWKNYPMHDENPCVLFCINDIGDIASLRPRVTDGSSCLRQSRGVCINGICKNIPCDLDLDSSAIEDVCGVCRGDSTSCKLVEGQIHVPCHGHIKEEQILIIPENSTNIEIEEMLPTESYIQVRSRDGKAVFIAGKHLGNFNLPGSTAWIGNIRTKQEAVSIPGPISSDISVWVGVVQDVTIKYMYGKPVSIRRKPEFSWDYLTWTRCSAECGPGIQESVPSCVEKIGGLVDEKYCYKIPKPKVHFKMCEIAPCINRWFIGDWQPCSKCPKGHRYRTVKCVRPSASGEGEITFISDGECAGPKPSESEKCTCTSNNPIGGREFQDTSNSTEVCSKLEDVFGKITIDKDDVSNMSLTIHVELENGRLPKGLPKPTNYNDREQQSYDVKGFQAMKFLGNMQKNFENNKTKI